MPTKTSSQCHAIAQFDHLRRRALQVIVHNALVVGCLGTRTLLLANYSHPQPLRHEAHFGIVANAHRRYCRIRWTSMKVGRRIGQLREWWRRWRRWLIGTRRGYRHVLFALRRRSLRICKKAWLAKYFRHLRKYGTAAMSARVSYHLSERTLRRAKGDAAHRAHRGSTRTPQWGGGGGAEFVQRASLRILGMLTSVEEGCRACGCPLSCSECRERPSSASATFSRV